MQRYNISEVNRASASSPRLACEKRAFTHEIISSEFFDKRLRFFVHKNNISFLDIVEWLSNITFIENLFAY